MEVHDRQLLYIKEPPNDPFAGLRAMQFKYFQEHRGEQATVSVGKNQPASTVPEATVGQTISFRVKSMGDITASLTRGSEHWESSRTNGKGGIGSPNKSRKEQKPSKFAASNKLSPMQQPKPTQLEYLSLSVGISYAPLPDVPRVSELANSTSSSDVCNAASTTLLPEADIRPSTGAQLTMQVQGSADRAGRKQVSTENEVPVSGRELLDPISDRKTVIPGAVRLSALIKKNDRRHPQTSHWRRQLKSFQLYGGQVGSSVVDEAAYDQYARRRIVTKAKPV